MISKELLKEVLREDIYNTFMDDTDDSRLWLKTNIGNQFINIHELVHMVKEWALGYKWIDSIDMYHWKGYTEVEITGTCKESGEGGCLLHTSTIKRQEDIFLYAEWILNETSK